MLTLVKCTVLNFTCNEYFDAYVLSESSLFVWNTKIILKTCGTTTLLNALPRLLEIAKGVGLHEVENLFYSRRNFLEPDLQHGPHKSFEQEVKLLDEHFDGSAFVLGKLNGEHWYLYMTEKPEKKENLPLDQTLEILMSDLDPKAMAPFFKKSCPNAEEATNRSGIADLFPGAICDDFLFDPCGYSVNGLVGNGYFTIHVTPQDGCSYASFETNVDLPSYTELIRKVVDVFRPGNMTITHFTNEPVKSIAHRMDGWDLEGYGQREKTFYQFEAYNLAFMSQHKIGQKASVVAPKQDL
jgi:S-adenosylmethionine decarboxylase